jgi:LasA protease
MIEKYTTKTHLFAGCLLIIAISLTLASCRQQSASASNPAAEISQPVLTQDEEVPPPSPTPFPTRPSYSPGELVDYTAQSGDSLPALAVRFNTSVGEILTANPFIPHDATTMPPGMPMQIPIYFLPFWGSPYQIIPDSLFVNGPAQVGFNTQEFVSRYPGWLNGYSSYVSGQNRTGAQVVDLIAKHYSVSPRLLLALLEYQGQALTDPHPSSDVQTYPLGYTNRNNRGLYYQLSWAADLLNDGYYHWRAGRLTELELLNGRIERPDPGQNAATVSLQHFFSLFHDPETYQFDISSEGLARTYSDLFGDPWENHEPHIPGSLVQPDFRLPFQARKTWAMTGGPHTAWGTRAPWSALDFAPPSLQSGCVESDEWATAVADGVVSRSEYGIVVLDLDGDGDERTGWAVFYLHIGTEDRAPVGTVLRAGDPLGHPSCEGGSSTGTHIHIARKYNGEWIPAGSWILPFTMEGWIAQDGAAPYLGSMTRYGTSVIANVSSDSRSFITSEIIH